MLTVKPSNAFKKDVRLLKKRNYNLDELKAVIELLKNGKKLPQKYRDHQLVGNLHGYRECHIRPDWLLIYQIREKEIILVLSRTGTHSDLLNM